MDLVIHVRYNDDENNLTRLKNKMNVYCIIMQWKSSLERIWTDEIGESQIELENM